MLFLTDPNIAANHFDAEIKLIHYIISPLTTELELAEMSNTDSEEDEETENEDESSRGINTHP